MSEVQIPITNPRIKDNLWLWEAYQGINNGRTYDDFKICDNFYLYQVILAAATAGNVHFKGLIDASTNPNYPAAAQGDQYEISVKGKIGGAAGVPVEPGDLIEANAANAGGTQAAVGPQWLITQFGLQQIFEITGSDLAFAVSRDLTETTGRDFLLTVTRDNIIAVGNNYQLTSVGNMVNICGGNFSAVATGTIQFGSTNFNVTTAGLMGINVAVPTATIHGVGQGATSATYVMKLFNSTPVSMFAVRNDGKIDAGLATGSITIGLSAGFVAANTGNTIIGVSAGASLTTGNNLVLIGYRAGNAITTATDSVLIGKDAGLSMTTGNGIAIGSSALQAATTFGANIAIGTNALLIHTDDYNIAIGSSALVGHTTGQDNIALGVLALRSNTTGASNLAIGRQAGNNNATGSGNIFIGYNSGYYETGSNKLMIDNASRTNEANARIAAMIYGVFTNTNTTQEIRFNCGIIRTDYLPTYATNAAALAAGLVAGNWYLVVDAVTGSKIIEVVQ